MDALNNAHTCVHCRRIEFDGTGPYVQQYFQFSCNEVRAFAGGCLLFEWCLLRAKKNPEPTDKLVLYTEADTDDVVYLNICWKDEFNQSLPQDNFCEGSQLHVFAKKDDPSARYIKSRPLRMSRRRPEDLRRCQERYARCLHHRECTDAFDKDVHSISPRRLLNVHQSSHELLYTVPKGNHPPYVALSYCWGDAPLEQAMTTKANVGNRHVALDLSAFPLTIQDAVEVCRSLRIDFIWIDALCIVQDDEEDKASEIAKMGSIYRGATLTIAVASAKSSTDGFLQDRAFKEVYGNLFSISYRYTQGLNVTRGSILLSERPIKDEYQEPIDKRGWTMQEDMLSIRLLRFGSKQTTWRCPKYSGGIKIDGGGCPIRENEDMLFTVDEPTRALEVRSKMIKFGALGSSNVYEKWQDTIEKYSLRELTKPKDRLSACAALSENFRDIMGLKSSDYLAGLWRTDLMAQLLWYRLEAPDLPTHLLEHWPKLKNPARSSGPSWSWASLDRPIRFQNRSFLQYDMTVQARTRYVDSQIEHRFKQYPYAEVESGRLDLHGRLKEAHWSNSGLQGRDASSERLPVTVVWDVVDEPSPKTVWCFEIVGSYITLGLVLVAKGKAAFERVGYFECKPREDHQLIQDWFGKVEPETISIQ